MLTLNNDEAVDPTKPTLAWPECRLSGSSPGVEHLLWACVDSAQQEDSSPSDPLPASDETAAVDRPRGLDKGPQTDAGNAARILSSGVARVPLVVTFASPLGHKF
ncbi:hypothetical protein IscW_ISCW019916 [Ixodes scapularis]|uniref:Uncharacterized protein n=1 Tax=Ixodes scapularis TaxID=6945 RepID=B7PV92_IXOSC|nr:hypothetical protein IscW_ISCW019916 [Ixodes scapularis]|eukprot:XP_002407545.1 hypothetical protein IscW_ISCW019916 [Ixodes scapularis]